MRQEQEMMALILGVAGRDARVRAVCMNGSRANPEAPRDIYQDYDIVYLVTELGSFRRDPAWVDVFGERVIMQLPDESALFEPDRAGRYGYLMQFTDGNRIDLTLIERDQAALYAREDSETVVLLDKDGLLPPLPPPDDGMYHIRRPDGRQFSSCCNEYWWVTPYVDKGLRRGEMPYAQAMFCGPVRDELMRMLTWRAGVDTGFGVSAGKCGKYLGKLLPPEDYAALLATYAPGDSGALRRCLEASAALFGKTARYVAAALGFTYREEEEARVLAFIRR